MGEGEDFSGHVPKVVRNAELKFFCKVSFEGNSSLYIQSQIAKVKVQTGRDFGLIFKGLIIGFVLL